MENAKEINRCAVLHIPCSEYAFAKDEHTLTVRLRAAKNNLTACTLYYGDRACPHTPVVCTAVPMRIVAEDELFSYFEGIVHSEAVRLCYYFKLEALEEWRYYYDGRFSHLLPELTLEGHAVDRRCELYQYPYLLRTELAKVPAWLKSARVYNIFPDSFASAESRLSLVCTEAFLPDGTRCRSRLGGTLKGITENLSYLRNLGINCLYLNPIFAALSYHKYDLVDYYHIDPCFGTNEDFAALVKKAHSLGMRVLLDGVFNHTSDRFFAFRDVMEKGTRSRYAGWYYDIHDPVCTNGADGRPNYACFAYVGSMPKLNTANPEVQQYFADVGSYWIREYGADGWRLDVANEVTKSFWRRFKTAVRAARPDAVLIGEVWENARDWLGSDLFDSTMDYGFRDACRDFFAMQTIDAAGFDGKITALRMRYPDAFFRAQLNLLDSHDVCRFLSLCGGDTGRMKQAIAFQMLFPGVPSVFYGDECGLQGVTESDYRSPMPWGKPPVDLSDFYRKALALHDLPAVQTGQFQTLSAVPGSRFYAYRLVCASQAIDVYLNTGTAAEKVSCPGKVLLCEGFADDVLAPSGILIVQRETAE